MNPLKLMNKYSQNKKIAEKDKNIFFNLIRDFIAVSDLEVLWHIIRFKNKKCVKKIFTTSDIILLTAAVAYVILPLDAIPDIILVLGVLDDVVVIKFIISTLGNKMRLYRSKCM